MIATEEGSWNVYVYPFDTEEEARRAFNVMKICRILFNPDGIEVDHNNGGNPFAPATVRKHTRNRTRAEQDTIGLQHQQKDNEAQAVSDSAAIGGAAGAAAGAAIAVPVAIGVINAVGFTAGGIASGSLAAAMMAAEAIAAGGGIAAGGSVATLQAVGAAGLMAGGPLFAVAAFAIPVIACAAVGSGIAASVAHFSSRHHWPSGRPGGTQTGLVPGKWMIATEEGSWNVYVYPFDTEEEARGAFNIMHICRILFNPDGIEVDHNDGGNPFAPATVRKHTRDRTRAEQDTASAEGK